jgi:glycerol uptake facilitator-like aquaporin
MRQHALASRRTRAAELYGTAAVFWLIFAAVATAAGIMRERWLVPRIGELRAHQLGTLLVCAMFPMVIVIFVRRTRPSAHEARSIGVRWVLLAIAFEFGFGHYLDGLSWSRLLADYDLSRGRLLLLVWLTVGAGPLVLTRVLTFGSSMAR